MRWRRIGIGILLASAWLAVTIPLHWFGSGSGSSEQAIAFGLFLLGVPLIDNRKRNQLKYGVWFGLCCFTEGLIRTTSGDSGGLGWAVGGFVVLSFSFLAAEIRRARSPRESAQSER